MSKCQFILEEETLKDVNGKTVLNRTIFINNDGIKSLIYEDQINPIILNSENNPINNFEKWVIDKYYNFNPKELSEQEKSEFDKFCEDSVSK